MVMERDVGGALTAFNGVKVARRDEHGWKEAAASITDCLEELCLEWIDKFGWEEEEEEEMAGAPCWTSTPDFCPCKQIASQAFPGPTVAHDFGLNYNWPL